MLIDSHCHIHDINFYPDNREEVYQRAIEAGVQMVVVGTSQDDSRVAVEFAAEHDGVWAAVGVHPHEAKQGWLDIYTILADYSPKQVGQRQDSVASSSLRSAELAALRQSSPGQELLAAKSGQPNNALGKQSAGIVAIGEIGLDYHYSNSPHEVQIEALEAQIDLALRCNLPIIFHVRDAYDDFWPVLGNFRGIRGVLHSFTDTSAHLEEGLKRNLFVSVNGISTFTKDPAQQAMFREIPLNRLLLETDAPFLTPSPLRGKVNEPAFVREVARYQAEVRGLSLDDITTATNANAAALFALK